MFRVQSQSSYVIVTNVSVLLDERHWCFSYLGWFYFDREFSIKTSVINIIDFISNKLFVRSIVLFVSNLSSTLLSTFIILVLAIYSFPLYLVISCSGRCKVCVSTFLWKPTNDNCTVLEKRLPTASLLILCRKWPAVKWIRTIVSLSFRESFRRSGKNSCVWPCRKCRSDANGLLSEVTTTANANHVIDNHPGSNSVCVVQPCLLLQWKMIKCVQIKNRKQPRVANEKPVLQKEAEKSRTGHSDRSPVFQQEWKLRTCFEHYNELIKQQPNRLMPEDISEATLLNVCRLDSQTNLKQNQTKLIKVVLKSPDEKAHYHR